MGAYHHLDSIHYHLIRTSPHYLARNGTDHIFTISHDIGSCLAPSFMSSSSIFMTHFSDTDSTSVLSYLRAMNHPLPLIERAKALPCFNSSKDIAIPPHLGERNTLSLDRFLTEDSNSRPIDVFFRGTNHPSQPSYSRGVRQNLSDALKDAPNTLISYDLHQDPKLYLDELKSSKFCLSPPGWVHWSPRVYQAIAVSCVPIIIQQDTAVLPFENFVDWGSFAIVANLTSYAAIVSDPVSFIGGAEKLLEMQQSLRGVWRNFTYGGPGMVVSLEAGGVEGRRPLGVVVESDGSPVLSHILSSLPTT